MNEPEMNCWGEYPDWEFEAQVGGVTIKETPEICKECELFNICFMNRSSVILWMPMDLSVEQMTQMVNMQRLMESGASDEVVWVYANHISSENS
jgi:hypothetical protein